MANLLPAFTDYTTDGVAISASSENSFNYKLWFAADGDPTTGWCADFSGDPQWIMVDFGDGNDKIAKGFSLTTIDDPLYAPNWVGIPATAELQASSNGTDWTTIASVTTSGFTGANQTQSYAADNSTAYRYYRLYCTRSAAEGYATVIIGEFGLLDTAPTPAVSATPASWPAFMFSGYPGAAANVQHTLVIGISSDGIRWQNASTQSNGLVPISDSSEGGDSCPYYDPADTQYPWKMARRDIVGPDTVTIYGSAVLGDTMHPLATISNPTGTPEAINVPKLKMFGGVVRMLVEGDTSRAVGVWRQTVPGAWDAWTFDGVMSDGDSATLSIDNFDVIEFGGHYWLFSNGPRCYYSTNFLTGYAAGPSLSGIADGIEVDSVIILPDGNLRLYYDINTSTGGVKCVDSSVLPTPTNAGTWGAPQTLTFTDFPDAFGWITVAAGIFVSRADAVVAEAGGSFIVPTESQVAASVTNYGSTAYPHGPGTYAPSDGCYLGGTLQGSTGVIDTVSPYYFSLTNHASTPWSQGYAEGSSDGYTSGHSDGYTSGYAIAQNDDALTVAGYAGSITTSATILGTTGTLDMSLYVAKTDVVSPSYVIKDVGRWDGASGEGQVGTYFPPNLDSNAGVEDAAAVITTAHYGPNNATQGTASGGGGLTTEEHDALMAIGTPLQASAYTAPDNAGISAIASAVAEIPTTPLLAADYTAPLDSNATQAAAASAITAAGIPEATAAAMLSNPAAKIKITPDGYIYAAREDGTPIYYTLDGTAYASRVDIEDIFGPENIAKWAIQSGNDPASTDGQAEIALRVAKALAYATAEIDNRLRYNTRYILPLSGPGCAVTVVNLCAAIAGVWLYEHKGSIDVDPESGQPRHRYAFVKKDAERLLDAIVSNKIKLDAPQETGGNTGPQAQVTPRRGYGSGYGNQHGIEGTSGT